jgi:hypothetical protein
MKKRLMVSILFGALLVSPMVGLTGCQSPNSTEPVALAENTDTEQVQASKNKSGSTGHRNWGKMRR